MGIKSALNPADDLSRGVDVKDIDSRWFQELKPWKMMLKEREPRSWAASIQPPHPLVQLSIQIGNDLWELRPTVWS